MRHALAFLLLALAPVAAQAQVPGQPRTSLAMGSWVEGALTPEAPLLEQDSSYIHTYTLGSDGGAFEVRLLSDDFDTFLLLFSASGETFSNDDHRNAWGESRIVVTEADAEAGIWTVGVNALQRGEMGAYTLTHRPLSGPLAAPSSLPEDGWLGGELTPESGVLDSDSTFFEIYPLTSDGGPFELRLLSYDFDPYLALQSPSGTVYENDDYDGTLRESRIIIGPDAAEAGVWEVYANTYFPGEVGEFALTHRSLSAAEVADLDRAEAETARESDLTRATSLLGQALVRYDESRFGDGVPLAQEALQIRRRLLAPEAPEVTEATQTLAFLLEADGQTSAALDTLAQAVDRAQAAPGVAVAPLLEAQGRILAASGDLDAAAAVYQQALVALSPPEAAAPDSAEPTDREATDTDRATALTLYFLGDVRFQQGRLDDAEDLFQQTLSIEERLLDPGDPDLALTLLALAGVLRADSAYADARPYLERALAIFESAFGPDHPQTASVANGLGEVVQLEAFASARPLYERALAAYETTPGSDEEVTTRIRYNLERLRESEADLLRGAPPTPSLRGPDVAVGTPATETRQGLDRALLFATDAYTDTGWDPLSNPIADAVAIATILHDRYGFDTTVVRNPTRREIYEALDAARRQRPPDNSQMFVFFAGHGTYVGDRARGRGFVVPRDGAASGADGASSSWLSYAALAEELDTLPDQRVLAVFDVCYGGSFVKRSRGGDDPVYRAASPREIMAKYTPYESRLALTSGALQYVSDGAPGRHSPFAFHLLRALRSGGGDDRDGLLLFDEMKGFVEEVPDQTPLAGYFGSHAPGGSFFFLDTTLDATSEASE